MQWMWMVMHLIVLHNKKFGIHLNYIQLWAITPWCQWYIRKGFEHSKHHSSLSRTCREQQSRTPRRVISLTALIPIQQEAWIAFLKLLLTSRHPLAWQTDEHSQSVPIYIQPHLLSTQNTWPGWFWKQHWKALVLCRSNHEFKLT